MVCIAVEAKRGGDGGAGDEVIDDGRKGLAVGGVREAVAVMALHLGPLPALE